MFKEHYIQMKGALTPRTERKYKFELEEKNQELQKL